jgi:hypothetical protein
MGRTMGTTFGTFDKENGNEFKGHLAKEMG